MAIRSVVWFVDGKEGIEPFLIAIKPNATKSIEVIVRTDGEPRLDKESLKWEQKLVRPANPLLPVPTLKISAQPVRNAGAAWQFPAIIQAPSSTGTYPDLEFDVSVRLVLEPGITRQCNVTVSPK
jgi:hypothetical protein